MNKKEHFFVVYDFEKDSRRSKCVKILEEYGVRIQYSVFEFFLSKAMKTELFARLEKKDFLQDNKGEAFMIIPISKDYSQKIERYGNTVDVLTKPGIFVV
jgi:CRISPR-associated protein Cas2